MLITVKNKQTNTEYNIDHVEMLFHTTVVNDNSVAYTCWDLKYEEGFQPVKYFELKHSEWDIINVIGSEKCQR